MDPITAALIFAAGTLLGWVLRAVVGARDAAPKQVVWDDLAEAVRAGDLIERRSFDDAIARRYGLSLPDPRP